MNSITGYVVVDLGNGGASYVGDIIDATHLGRTVARDAAMMRAKRLNREGGTTRYTYKAVHEAPTVG